MATEADEVNIKFGASIDELKSKLGLVLELFKGIGEGARAELSERAGGAFSDLGKTAATTGDIIKGSFIGTFAAGFARDFINELAAIPGRFAGMITGAIDAADHLNDLSKIAGISVEVIGGIGFAASQAGGNLETAAASINKLNKNIAAAAAGDKEAMAPFVAMGIELTDATGRIKSADVVMAEMATKFEGYADGPEKVALAIKTMGRSGADMIPILNDGGKALQENIEYYLKYAGITTETAQRADEFNDTLGKLNLISSGFGRQLAAELLPSLQAVADEILRVRENSDIAATIVAALRTVFETVVIAAANVAYVMASVGREVGAMAAQMVALAHLDFAGFNAISESVKADAARARKELDAFEQRVLQTGTRAPAGSSGDWFASKGAAAMNQGEKQAAPGMPHLTKPRAAQSTGEDKVIGAQLALQKADQDAALALFLEYLKEDQAANEDAFKAKLTTLQDYYDRKLALDLEANQLTLEARRKDAADAEATANTARAAEAKATTPKDRSNLEAQALKAEAEQAKLLGQINVLEAQRGEIVRRNGVERSNAQQKLEDELAAIAASSARARADSDIAIERGALEQMRALRQVSAQDAFDIERQLEARSYAVLQADLDAKRALIHGNDQKGLAQAAAEEEAAERAHQAKLIEIDRSAAVERAKYSVEAQRGVESGFATMISQLLSGTARIGTAFRQFGVTIAKMFEDLIAKRFAERLFGAGTAGGKMVDSIMAPITNALDMVVAKFFGTEAAKTTAVATGTAQRTALEASAASASQTATSGSAIANIGAKAWEAAASVYASIAQIPVVGPFLAPAAAIAASAVVLGFIGRVASSEGGDYRVDQDRLNFVHKDETILPANFASGLRALVGEGGASPLQLSMNQILHNIGPGGAPVAAQAWSLPNIPSGRATAAPASSGGLGSLGGGARGAGGDVHFHVNAIDGQSVKRFLHDNRQHIASALRGSTRDFGTGKS